MLENEDDVRLQALINTLTLSGSDPDGRWQEFHLRETALDFIIPDGDRAAYARDENGHIVGFKFGSPPVPQRTIELICEFSHLERLVFHASDNAVKIPPAIAKLTRLKFVSFGGTVSRLPEEILALNLPLKVSGHSSSSDNEPDGLDKAVVTFLQMKQLYREQLETDRTAEDELALFRVMSTTDKNTIASVSAALVGVYFRATELQDPPLEIVSRGNAAVASYFQDRKQGSLHLNEVKVLLVGNGSCGKTSLVKRLMGQNFDPGELQTHGIKIHNLTLGTKKQGRVKANFWDFGGQEIMHATHQFFLSKRSLYLLVLDGRKEEDAEYWLQHIQSFGGDSPIIILLNKFDENPSFDLNRRFLINKFPAITGFFRISCLTNFGVAEFKDALYKQVTSAAILQTTWPKSWFKVKQKLKISKANYISVAEYNRICDSEGITEASSREALVEFLHDLGVVLHFKEVQLLDTHVLDPLWVTEGVYKIINSTLLAHQRGFLRLSQLSQVFRVIEGDGQFEYPPEKFSYLVELMLKFELCYKLDASSILIPDLLDIQEPDIPLDDDAGIRFVFQYEYLPKSVVPRFIVRLHNDVKAGASWRTGAVLEDKVLNTTAILRSDDKAKRIYLSVSGKQKRDYFAVLRKVLNDINGSFEKLLVTELVILPETTEILVEYNELIGYELSGKQEYFVGRLQKAFSVGLLLDGIEDKQSRAQHTAYNIVNVQGPYLNQPIVSEGGRISIESDSRGGHVTYQPALWEKVVSYSTAVLFVGVLVFLLIRNQPISDSTLAVALRIVLSLVVAIFGASVPGMLRVNLRTTKGVAIRATGALAIRVGEHPVLLNLTTAPGVWGLIYSTVTLFARFLG